MRVDKVEEDMCTNADGWETGHARWALLLSC